MNAPEQVEPPTTFCPVCNAPVDPVWRICSKCAANIKRDHPKPHYALWFAILAVFLIAEVVAAVNNAGTLIGIGMIFGLPLAWWVGNTALNLLKGSPHAGQSVSDATLRYLFMAFVIFIVVPTMLAV